MSHEVKINLRELEYSPDQNPLLTPSDVPLKKKRVRSGLASKTLVDAETGEVAAASVVHQIEEKDEEHFVKVFAAGIAAAYELTRTGQRVFQAILQEYERAPMSSGYAEAVYLSWFGDGLSGQDIGMSEKTFQRGLKELLAKDFLSPKTPNVFWVNPALFFKGDRFLLVKEYRRKVARAKTEQEILEEQGQERLEIEC
ncbi:hypothetical protein M4K04_004433 [Escherichia coli]|nr:hypothetical protein [Escherichia coli]